VLAEVEVTLVVEVEVLPAREGAPGQKMVDLWEIPDRGT